MGDGRLEGIKAIVERQQRILAERNSESFLLGADGRTGVRPTPDVPRGCPPHSFLRQEGPRIHQPLTFLSQQSFGYCPRPKRLRSNTHAGVVGYLCLPQIGFERTSGEVHPGEALS